MPCSEFLDSVSLLSIASSSPYFSGTARGAVGDLGERAAIDIIVNVFGWEPAVFKGKNHGFDGVFIDTAGNLVIMEAKGTARGIKSPNSLLPKVKNKVKEMSRDWIIARANLMQDSSYTDLYTPENKALGIAIIQAEKDGKLRAVLVETSGKEKAAGVYERDLASDDWNLIQSIS